MVDNKTDTNEQSKESLNVNLSAGDNKIKYYECNRDNCIFEILNDSDKDDMTEKVEDLGFKSDNSENGFKFINDKSDYETQEKSFEINDGKITIRSIIDYGKKEELSGVKVNLYKINGLSPILIKSGITDKEGKIIFDNIHDGCYRVIEIVDKRYFEKPKYINWNEITINYKNKDEKVLIVNKIKSLMNQK